MNANVETLRELLRTGDLSDWHSLDPALQAAIAALEAQGEAVGYRYRVHPAKLRHLPWTSPGIVAEWGKAAPLDNETIEYQSLYLAPPSSPAVQCCACGGRVDRETGSQLHTGAWTCCADCWEKACRMFDEPASSPAMRAVVEAAKDIIRPAGSATRMTSGYGHVVNEDEMDGLRDALAHPEVKKLMGEE